MTKTIDAKMLEMVEEIESMEKKLMEARSNASLYSFVPTMKQQHTEEADMLEKALDRKLKLLMILKG